MNKNEFDPEDLEVLRELWEQHQLDQKEQTMKYRVIQWVTVSVPVEVEASSMLEAIKIAESQFHPEDANKGTYSDEILGHLVDPLLPDGTPDTANSVRFDYDDKGRLCIDEVPVPDDEELIS